MPYNLVVALPVDEHGFPTTPGGINGGMYRRADGGGGGSPVLVIEVPSCEQRVGDVEAAGGERLMGPAEIPDMGIYAQVKDAEGNIIGLWQPLS